MPDFSNVATLTKQVNNNLPAKRFLSSFFRYLYPFQYRGSIDGMY